MTRFAYRTTLVITDEGLVLVPNVIQENADVLGITLRHATRKLGQTIGVSGRTHSTKKTSLKMSLGKFCKQWHKYSPIAILKYNTMYHTNRKCEISRVFY